ncbi:tRNA (guanine(46)-N(7))-methyltransferase TrmB [Tepidamorphus sp. 3E244]|uniref:tRNA (guanine(46)-N(7))-methyltransferase TrmB n=1 Tax=Tepidamorphus sp. 3E244 TaxID=3385498 RepID=UPI0038FC7C0A
MAQEGLAKRLHGRRKGHALKARQGRLMEQLLPRIAVEVEQPAPARLADLFETAPDRLILEIGFGGGEHLAEGAASNPQTGFIGAEAFINGVAKLLSEVDTRELTNVRVHFGDAHDLLEWLPDACLDRADLLYLDPWRKRRHWKRRFISHETLAELARVIRPGGELRFASDWPDYLTWTLMHLRPRTDFAWTAQVADDWRKPWDGWTRTRYEAKAYREGRVPSYLTFTRT